AFNGSVIESTQVDRIFRLMRGQIVNLDVTHDRNKFSFVAFFVIEIDGNACHGHLPYGYVTGIDVFDVAATHGIVLDPHRTGQVRAVHAAVFRKHIAHAAGDLASNPNSAVAVLHAAIPDNDVFR